MVLFGVVVVCLLVAGCASSEYRHQPVTLFVSGDTNPGAHRPAIPYPDVADLPERMTRLTLFDAIRESIAYHPGLQAESLEVEQARAELLEASAAPNPELAIEAEFALQGLRANKEVPSPVFEFGIAYELDWLIFGKRDTAIDAARMGIEVAVLEYAEEVREHVAELIEAFYDVLEAQAMLEVVRDEYEALLRVVDIVREQVEAGAVPALELTRLRPATLELQREVRDHERELQLARLEFRTLLGREIDDPDFELVGSLEPFDVPTPQATDALRQAIAHRPDYQALGLAIRHAELERKAERREGMPGIEFGARYVYEYNRWQSSGGEIERDEHLLGLELAIELPFFDRNQGGVRAAEVAIQQARFWQMQALREIQTEVHASLIEYEAARRAVFEEIPQIVAAAREAHDVVEQAYVAGGLSLLDLLDAQEELREALREETEARIEYWRAVHAVNTAVGTQILP